MKRLIKYGQDADIKQEIVLKSFSALLKMSVAYKGKKLYIKNFEAMLCSLFCLKVLLKSKT